MAAAEREHAAAAKDAEDAKNARQAVTAKTQQLTKQRDDVMVVRRGPVHCFWKGLSAGCVGWCFHV